jgi:hypothetical protein
MIRFSPVEWPQHDTELTRASAVFGSAAPYIKTERQAARWPPRIGSSKEGDMTNILRNLSTARWRPALRAGALAVALAAVAGAPIAAQAAGYQHGGGGHAYGGHGYVGHGYVGHGGYGWGGHGWAGYHPGWGWRGYYGPACYPGYGPYCYPPGVTVAIP